MLELNVGENTMIGDPCYGVDSDGQVRINTIPGKWPVEIEKNDAGIPTKIIIKHPSLICDVSDIDAIFIDSDKVGVFDVTKFGQTKDLDSDKWLDLLTHLTQNYPFYGLLDGVFVARSHNGACDIGLGIVDDKIAMISIIPNLVPNTGGE